MAIWNKELELIGYIKSKTWKLQLNHNSKNTKNNKKIFKNVIN
jgi:hypothetical protein